MPLPIRPQASAQRSETVRRANLSSIVRALDASGSMSRSELVDRTGLTRSAIRSHIGDLSAGGLVVERRARPMGLPGRPSPVVSLDSRRVSVIAMDIAVDSLAVAHVGPSRQLIAYRRVERPRGHASVASIVDELAALSSEVHPAPIDGSSVLGIGVAVAGVVHAGDGTVRRAPNLDWTDEPLGARLTAALATDVPVTIANEADLGALAEVLSGAAVGTDNLIYVSGEVGVGGGILIDGRPLSGAAGYAGEIGHMPVNPAGVECRCGAIGCWETEIGEEALLRLAGRPESGGRPAVDAVLAAAQAGDTQARDALNRVGHWLGLGLAGLVNVFDPELIVLGGRFARLAAYVGPIVESELDSRALAASRNIVRVVPAALSDDAPLLGAAELALEPLLADPAQWLGPRAASKGNHPSGNGQWRAVA